MSRLLARMMTVATVSGCVMVSAAELAQAAPSTSISVDAGNPKTRAAEAFFNRSNGTHANKAWFDVNDTKCDGNDVYVEYSIDGSRDYTQKYNSGGCGTSKGHNLRTGHFAIVYRVCVDDAGTNTCSGWRGDNN